VRVQLGSLLQVRDGRGIVERIELRRPQHQARLGGIAAAEDAVDHLLSALDLVGPQKRHSEHICDREVIRIALLDGCQQLDDFGVRAFAQPAIGQQQRNLPVVRLKGI
jgi:hypothetical protein